MFPEGYYNEIQVTATVVSSDKTMEADIAAMLGTSAALAIAGTPFRGPIGAARVGLINGEYVLNPNFEQMAQSDLDLVVAGTESAVLMVESEAKELSEDQMLGAVLLVTTKCKLQFKRSMNLQLLLVRNHLTGLLLHTTKITCKIKRSI